MKPGTSGAPGEEWMTRACSPASFGITQGSSHPELIETPQALGAWGPWVLLGPLATGTVTSTETPEMERLRPAGPAGLLGSTLARNGAQAPAHTNRSSVSVCCEDERIHRQAYPLPSQAALEKLTGRVGWLLVELKVFPGGSGAGSTAL